MSPEKGISQIFSIDIEVAILAIIVYADNAATTKLDIEAFEAMKPYLLEEYGNASQPYSFARAPKKQLKEARAVIASCIGASPEEIFFTSCGTESDNWAIKGSSLRNSEKRATITTAFEHHALLHSCEAIERQGFPVAYMWPEKNGTVSAATLERYITDQTYLVSVMFANNEIGSIQPIKELCAVAHSHGAMFHTDAVQAVGHIPIDVHKLQVDMLSASAHKFNGPKGIGFLYIRKGIDLPPYMDGGAQESGLRAGTENIASIVGMAAALKANCSALESNRSHLLSLEKELLSRLDAAGVVYARNGGNDTLPGLLSLSFPGQSGEALLHRLDLMGICVSTGSACDSVNTEISHVLKAIDLDESLAEGTIRISLGKNNLLEEATQIAQALVKIMKGLSSK